MAQGERIDILLEAEQFDEYGGWVLDSLFEKDMGSAYLMAHGLGKPVEDALTTFNVPREETYRLWARVKDWVPEGHPGRFAISIDGAFLSGALGADGLDWHWQLAGEVSLQEGEHEIRLQDLTGFDGRCDAVLLTSGDAEPPERGIEVNRPWRRALLGVPEKPADAGVYDTVVVGGGIPAAAAAIAAAKTGSKVALICDRPVIGGNASSEVGLGPRGFKTPLVEKMIERKEDSSLGVESMVASEPGIDLLLNERAFDCEMDGARITAVIARNLISGAETRFRAQTFIDASGKGALAKPAGAELRTGREGKGEFSESLAPDKPDDMHHGHTLLYHVQNDDEPFDFPKVPWATSVSKDFSCLAGQMGHLSEDNQPGPCAGEPETPEEAKAKAAEAGAKLAAGVQKDHMFPPEEVIHLFPGTHFWEYGQFLDMDEPGNEEYTRDYLMRALYGTMSNVKKAMPEKYAGLRFSWLHHVPATGEYCRIMGDAIVAENDVRNHTSFPDTVVLNSDPFCLHYPGDEKYDFRLGSWVYDMRDGKPYEIPFRCLYSKNIDNLMMAGKQISVSRVVGSSTKVMANGAQHGIAVGCAASLAARYGEDPRDIGRSHLDELREMIASLSEQ